jgi:hypothetical protein
LLVHQCGDGVSNPRDDVRALNSLPRIRHLFITEGCIKSLALDGYLKLDYAPRRWNQFLAPVPLKAIGGDCSARVAYLVNDVALNILNMKKNALVKGKPEFAAIADEVRTGVRQP